MSSFLGIDLGTTFSAMATIDDSGRPVIVHNSEGENITPSCVTEEDGAVEVGEFARRAWGADNTSAAARFKREMGTDKKYRLNEHSFNPVELSSFVLKKLAQDAEKSIGEIGEVVVTVPANFANDAREATMQAAKKAGLNVNYIINEPTAAALFYSHKNGGDFHGNYAVYDLGGGTFDVSIIRVDGHQVDVLATNGVSKLGGDDFDRILVELVQKKYKDQTGETLESEDFTTNNAEDEKKSLSKRKSVLIRVNKKQIELKREEYEEAISNLVTQAELLCESSIEEAKLDVSDIKAVLLAGGSTRIPMVRHSIERVFGQKPLDSANVDEVVALGAALYAAYRGDRSQLSAAQAATIDKINVTEITSKCFGTLAMIHNEARNEQKLANSILIYKGDKIPASVTESFFTMHDDQDAVDCRVTESVAPETDPAFVKIIWDGNLDLPSGRAAGQEIKITYTYDSNQIMRCSFVDIATSKKTEIEISMTQTSPEGESKIDQFLVE